MIVSGFLVNRTGKHKFIFKRNVGPNRRVALKDLYEMYELKCGCKFDEQFIAWLKENKVPKSGWEFEGLETVQDAPVRVVAEVIPLPDNTESKISVQRETEESKVTSRYISNLKIKDKPRQILNQIESIPKLRRALTLVNKKKGKAFLVKLIKLRINKLLKLQESSG